MAKRIVLFAAVLLCLWGAMPLLTGVNGQQVPDGQLQYEVQEMQKEVNALPDMKTQLALLSVQIKEEQEKNLSRWQRQEEFQSKLIWGMLGTAGSVFMALFIWLLNHLGIYLGVVRKGDPMPAED